MEDLKEFIREVPDYPKPGILFYDITTLLQNPHALRMTVDRFVWLFSGKLPSDSVSESYELEYGTDTLEMHSDAVEAGENVLIVDDLIATGGTALATTRLVESLGGKVVGLAFLIELTFLEGRKPLDGYWVESLIRY